MAASPSAPPNLYSSMASMPGPMPAKKNDDTEELMKGFHGIFKLMAKMEEKRPGLSKKLAIAKNAMKDAVASELKGDPSTLDETDTPPPPPSDDNTPPPPPPAPGPAESNSATPTA
jgi:hypothetical protein